MSSKNQNNNQYSGKIIKILAQKPAMSVNEIQEGFPDQNRYSVTRSLKGLRDAGLIEPLTSTHHEYARLTKEGKKKMHSLALDNDTTLVNTSWDGFWRIILLDLPESRKSERESLRYLLKKAGFVCLKNSAWISPLPYEHLFINIKKDLGLTTEMMIVVTQYVDEETKKYLFESFGE